MCQHCRMFSASLLAEAYEYDGRLIWAKLLHRCFFSNDDKLQCLNDDSCLVCCNGEHLPVASKKNFSEVMPLQEGSLKEGPQRRFTKP